MKKVLLINPNKDFFSNPMLVLLLDELMEQNTDLNLIYPAQYIDLPSKYSGCKQLQFTAFNVNWTRKFWKSISKILSYWKVIRYCKKNQISSVVGVDPVGIIIAGRIQRFLKKSSLHYISFELFFKDELSQEKSYLKIKEKEVNYTKKIKSLVIQDEVRFESLRQENQLETTDFKTFFVPVSPAKIEFTEEEKNHWRNQYRKKLGIQQDQTVLIHSGSVAPWGGGEMILKLLELGLPEECILLIHSKFPLDETDPLHKKLIDKQKNGASLILHNAPFSNYEEYLQFLLCTDIGLVLYEADYQSPYTGKNLKNIGLSSGKFACYMSLGIPAITTYSITYSALNEKYNFGIVIENVEQLKESLTNQKEFLMRQDHSTDLYNQELDCRIRIKAYVDFIS